MAAALLLSEADGAARLHGRPAPTSSFLVPVDPVAIAAGGTQAWVLGRAGPSSRQGSLLRLDDRPLRTTRLAGVGGMPTDVAVSSSSVWASSGPADRFPVAYPNSVVRVARASGRRIAVVPVFDPAALAVEGQAVWALSAGGPTGFSLLRRVSAANRITASIRIRGTSFRPALAVGGGYVWTLTVGRLGGRRQWFVTRVSTETAKVIGSAVRVDGVGQDVLYANGAAWVSTIRTRPGGSSGAIWRIGRDGTRATRTDSFPSAALLGASGDAVWVVTGKQRVTALDPRTGRRTGRSFSVPGSVTYLAVAGDRIWAVDRLRRRVTVVRL